MTMIDVNAFLGPWPFLPAPARDGRALARHLAAEGITRALVSHLGAVFLQDPMPANHALWDTARGVRSLVPVPILNPSMAAWSDHLAECQAAGALHAVRILPNYHGYSLRDRRLLDFIARLEAEKIPLILQARLEDERNRYFGLTVKGVPARDIGVLLQRFPRTHVLCAGLYRGEIEKLAAQCPNFSAEFSFAEWITTVEALRATLTARRILVGSGTPLLSTRAQTAKLRHARLSAREREAIASGNARRFFRL